MKPPVTLDTHTQALSKSTSRVFDAQEVLTSIDTNLYEQKSKNVRTQTELKVDAIELENKNVFISEK